MTARVAGLVRGDAMGAWPATKVVCTLGPATDGHVPELLAAGASVVRLNLAHGTPAEHGARVEAVRAAARQAGREVAILADLPGPKVRLGALRGGSADLETGSTFVLRAADPAGSNGPGDGTGVNTTHPGLADDLQPGDHVHLADGAVELVVRRVTGREVVTVVERGGTVRSRVGVSVPSERLSLPVIGNRDRELARFAADAGVDLLGQSFVRADADVEELRRVVGPGGPGIVAKIETRPAVDAFEAIAHAADGVMIARGDLGLDLPFETVPLVQKRLVASAVAMGRPVIVATQMLESMLAAPRPTRAEASDVANAVIDGADAVMLSGETAIGSFPLLAVRAAIRICLAAEAGPATVRPPAASAEPGEPGRAGAVATAAVALAAADHEVVALIVVTDDASVVRAVAARRPGVPIVAIVGERRVARRLLAVRGVVPVVPAGSSLLAGTRNGHAADLVNDPAVRAVLALPGRLVVLTAGDSPAVDRIELLAGPAAPEGSHAP